MSFNGLLAFGTCKCLLSAQGVPPPRREALKAAAGMFGLEKLRGYIWNCPPSLRWGLGDMDYPSLTSRGLSALSVVRFSVLMCM